MLFKRIVTFGLSCLMIPGLSWAQWEGPCITTKDLNNLNPQYVATPLVMYWKAKVEKEVVLVMVKVPESQQILLNFIECTHAEIRDNRPAPEEGHFDCDNMVRLGDFWLPLADIEEQSEEAVAGEFNVDHPTEFFSSRVSSHLQEYADSMKWDPTISAAFSSVDQLFLGMVGYGIWHLAGTQKMAIPKSSFLRGLSRNLSRIFFRRQIEMQTVNLPRSFAWKRFKLGGLQTIGMVLMLRQAYAIASGARSEFVEERNQRAAHLETLIQQINEKMTMRLDGQDRGQNLEETDGYSALVNSIKKANDDALAKFCNNNE